MPSQAKPAPSPCPQPLLQLRLPSHAKSQTLLLGVLSRTRERINNVLTRLRRCDEISSDRTALHPVWVVPLPPAKSYRTLNVLLPLRAVFNCHPHNSPSSREKILCMTERGVCYVLSPTSVLRWKDEKT